MKQSLTYPEQERILPPSNFGCRCKVSSTWDLYLPASLSGSGGPRPHNLGIQFLKLTYSPFLILPLFLPLVLWPCRVLTELTQLWKLRHKQGSISVLSVCNEQSLILLSVCGVKWCQRSQVHRALQKRSIG